MNEKTSISGEGNADWDIDSPPPLHLSQTPLRQALLVTATALIVLSLFRLCYHPTNTDIALIFAIAITTYGAFIVTLIHSTLLLIIVAACATITLGAQIILWDERHTLALLTIAALSAVMIIVCTILIFQLWRDRIVQYETIDDDIADV